MSSIHSSFVTRARSRRDGRARRGGQALILAVLVMILAALTGAVFIAVVSLNINQTARQSDRAQADAAARAGIEFINERILNSRDGEGWRPPALPAPLPFGYYNAIDRAQGWEGAGFVKYPAPNVALAPPDGTPLFMARVTTEPAGGPRAGMLRIEVVGLADENASAWERRVVFKPTSANGSPLFYARYDANFDARRDLPAVTRTTANPTVVTVGANPVHSVPVRHADGFAIGQTVNFTINATTTGNAQAIIQNIDRTGPTPALVLNRQVNGLAQNQVVRLASRLVDNVNTINEPGNPAFDINDRPALPGTFSSVARTAANLPTRLHFNAALVTEGRVLVALNPATGDAIHVAGRIANDCHGAACGGTNSVNGFGITRLARFITTADPTIAAERIPVPQTADAAGMTAAAPSVRDGNDGLERNDPSALVNPVAPAPLNEERYRDLTLRSNPNGSGVFGYGAGIYINNAADRERVGAGTDAASVLDNAHLHRLWQRKSFRRFGPDGTPIAGGNITYTGAAGPIATGANAHRLSWPRLPDPERVTPFVGDTYTFPLNTGSLEERGIRGWISPWEFVPRGVQVELRGDRMIITREARTDVDARPNPNLAWKRPDGSTFDIANAGDRAYRAEIIFTVAGTNVVRQYIIGEPGPAQSSITIDPSVAGGGPSFNGVFFAEGNIRVRGHWNADLPDLTFVSMNNIYVAGPLYRTALGATTPVGDFNRNGIALLAKKNVAVNPTQIVARPSFVADRDFADVESQLLTPVGAGATTLNLSDTSHLRIGDRLLLEGSGTIHTVIQLPPTGAGPLPGVVTIAPPVSAAIDITTPGNLPVRLVGDPPVLSTDAAVTTAKREYFRLLEQRDPSNPSSVTRVLMRRVSLDGTQVAGNPNAGNKTLAIRMAGQRAQAMNFERLQGDAPTRITTGVDGRTAPVPAGVGTPDGIFQEAERRFFTRDHSPGQDFNHDLNDLLATGTSRYDDGLNTLAALSALFVPTPPDAPIWRANLAPGVEALPARRLAAIGHWNDYQGRPPGGGVADDALTSEVHLNNPAQLPDIPQNWDIPLTTSVRVELGGTRQALIGTRQTASNVTGEIETVPFVAETFYQRMDPPSTAMPTPRTTQTLLRAGNVTLPGATWGDGEFVTVRHNGGTPSGLRITDLKIERDNWNIGGVARAFTPITLPINASIFAETGSYFLISAPIQGGYDINGNRTIDIGDSGTGTRYGRLNYRFEVRGSIAQAWMATSNFDQDGEPDPDDSARGALLNAFDALAFPARLVTTPSYLSRGTDYESVKFLYTRRAADHTLRLPATRELLFQN